MLFFIWQSSCTGCRRSRLVGCPSALSAGRSRAFCVSVRRALVTVGWCMVVSPTAGPAPSTSWAVFSYSHALRGESYYICRPVSSQAAASSNQLTLAV